MSMDSLPTEFFAICDWADEFCDCRDLGTICCLLTEENLCARHYWKRLGGFSTQDLIAGVKKPTESVVLSERRYKVGKST
jgi:hypothetical protein